MNSGTPPEAGGLARRRRRISDEETETRMLDAAQELVNRTGLTVSLEHISFEEVIRDADVSRSAVYRRWPYKDLFFSDLLKRLAGDASPAVLGANPDAVATTSRALLEHLDWLHVPELRRALAAEALRQAGLNEFETFHRSPQWRTYFALHATFRSLPDGQLRDEVQRALTRSEGTLLEGVATAYERVSLLLGLRLRPESGMTFETVASLATATIRGLVLMAPANPAVSTQRCHANPFGAPEAAEWSQPALAIAAVTVAQLEPAPDAEFDDERIAAVREALRSGSWASAGQASG